MLKINWFIKKKLFLNTDQFPSPVLYKAGQTFSPEQLWESVGGAIQYRGKVGDT